MNNINRGVLIGIRMTLERIRDIVNELAVQEQWKEVGSEGGAPIGSHSEEVSDEISDISDRIEEAIDAIKLVVPQEADFEWVQYTKTSDK